MRKAASHSLQGEYVCVFGTSTVRCAGGTFDTVTRLSVPEDVLKSNSPYGRRQPFFVLLIWPNHSIVMLMMMMMMMMMLMMIMTTICVEMYVLDSTGTMMTYAVTM